MSRTCCCSTSPSTASTRSASRRPWRSSPTPARAAPASCSPPTCATSRSRPAARRSCCAAATGSPRCRPATSPARPTVPSSTDTGPHAWLEAARDTRHLMAFRARTVRRRGAAFLGLAVVVVLTAVFAVVPSRVDLRSGGSAPFERALAALESNLGAAFAGFLLLAVGAAMGSGGGRELLSRSEAAVHPISPVTEHLGALLFAPVNLAWVLAATALGQAAGWAVEGVRRTARGVLVVRIGAGAVVVGLAALHLAGLLAPLARSLPTTWLADTSQTGRWPLALGALLLLTVTGLVLGARPAAWALGLPPREELRVQSGVHEARHVPEPRWGSADRALLRRLDRGSVWRSVGMRRGLMVLGIGPGLVALA